MHKRFNLFFNHSYQSYGTRRIRKALSNQGIIVSRRDVVKVMKALSLKAMIYRETV